MGERPDSFTHELSIGQMAKLNQVSERTLRVYHKKGIFMPSRVDEDTGFRYYEIHQCSMLDMVQQMKELGFSLDEIKHFVDANDVDELEAQVDDHLRQIEDELARLNRAKGMGQTLLASCAQYKRHPPFGELRYETLPERRFLRLAKISTPPDAAIDEAMAQWEYTLRTCKKLMLEGAFPSTLFRNISDTIPEESLRREDPRYGDAIAFVDESYGNLFEKAEVVPEGLFAVLYDDTFSDEDGRYIEPRLAKQMVRRLREDGYEVAGDYIGEVLAETPMFYEKRHNMLARLQIPVKPQ